MRWPMPCVSSISTRCPLPSASRSTSIWPFLSLRRVFIASWPGACVATMTRRHAKSSAILSTCRPTSPSQTMKLRCASIAELISPSSSPQDSSTNPSKCPGGTGAPSVSSSSLRHPIVRSITFRVAVGTRVASRPLRRSGRAPLCIRLLPRVPDGETLVGPGMKNSRLWEPIGSQLLHSSPGETAFLAASAECPTPAFDDLGTKGSQRSPIGRHCVVVEEAGDDLLQPFTLFGYRLMHPPSQFPRNLLDLRLHAVATGPPLEEEFSPARLSADEGHTEKVEGLRFAEPALLTVVRRTATKLNQAGLFRM